MNAVILSRTPPTAAPLGGRGLIDGLLAIPVGQGQRDALADDLARYLGSRRAMLADSGRTALYLLLRHLREQADSTDRRRYVVLPAYTCPAVARVILSAGLSLRLVDVDPTTLDYEPEAIERSIDEAVLAVVLVHPLGLSRPVEPVRSLARRAGAWLIEDVAQALGARALDGKPTGAEGDFALGSFGPGKPISAGGGGVLFANTADAARLAEAAWQGLPNGSPAGAALAWGRALAMDLAFRRTGWWAATRLGVDRLGNSEVSWGFRVRGLSGAQAALARDGMRRIDGLVAARRCNAARLIRELADHPSLRVVEQDPTAGDASYLRLVVLTRDPATREAAFERSRRAGVGVGRLYPRTVADLFPAEGGPFPGADRIARCILTLPTHPRLAGRDLDLLAATLRAAVSL